ncbi:MAG: sulfotransferase family 2 domain-containing protein [Okeania sp. SIO2F4]|uniref:sulfotransferase family 2 domain-containing protein n=1 Tax=Okeania sp. SIO2F4 TaxID=2607790 RepID=UPI00142AAA2E|nr:sulfotransferase family 2 domain-containing protein [Okeania sp. SIO2F4]NES01424.1 sulfotransferase family 2 domain-containing protein [Okeania sp. SIO2F4]
MDMTSNQTSPTFIFKWNLDWPNEKTLRNCDRESKVEFRGWVLAKGNLPVRLVLRQNGVNQFYDLNESRPDVIRKILNLSEKNHSKEMCGFRHSIALSGNFDFGFEKNKEQIQWIRSFDFLEKNEIKKLQINPEIEIFEDRADANHSQDVYLFIHIPKTAGTSFRKGLEKQLGSSRILYDYGARSSVTSPIIQSSIYRKSIDGTSLQEYIQEQSINVIGGHINQHHIKYYCSILGKRTKLITFLREPIRRCLSDYFHHVYHYNYSGDIQEFIFKKNKSNLQSRMLKEIELESLYFVGITEKYNDSVDFFNRISQNSIPSLTLNKNKKIQDFLKQIPEQTLDFVIKQNEKDLELYKNAVDIFEQKLSGIDSDLPSSV